MLSPYGSNKRIIHLKTQYHFFTHQFGKHFENWLVLVMKQDEMGTAIYDG